MTPLHPRFRALLLKNRKNRQSGLTPAILHEYETLLNCYYMASGYFYQRNVGQIDNDCGYEISDEILNILENDPRIPEAIVKKISILDRQFFTRDKLLQVLSQLLDAREFKKYGGLVADFAKKRPCVITAFSLQRLKKHELPETLLTALNGLKGQTFGNPAHLESELRRQLKEKVSEKSFEQIAQAANDITCYTEILLLREQFIPAYQEVKNQWLGLQKSVLQRREYDLGFLGHFGHSFQLIFRWWFTAFRSRKPLKSQ